MSPLHIFQLILAALAVALVLPIATRRLPIPPAAALVLGGIVLAAIPGTPVFEIDPDLIMTLFLPPLLLSSAFFTVWRDFRADLRPILLLAIGAVTFTTFLVGCAARWAVPSLPWGACFALGAIVSPPDAVAAKAVLHNLPLPRRVVTILEGESLVNDASGLLLYKFAVAAALTGLFHPGEAAVNFVWLSVGGVLFGIAVARVSIWIMARLHSAHESILMSFLTAWMTYIAAELLDVSSVLAVVACGLTLGWRRHDAFTAQARTEISSVWRFVVTVFETLVFVLIGLSLRGVLDRLGGPMPAFKIAAPIAIAVVLAVVLSRFLWVVPGMYLTRVLSPSLRKKDPVDASIGLIIGWAGMRGVVSLAAALALPKGFPGRDLLLFATFAVIAVTVLVQGATLGPLIRLVLKPQLFNLPGPKYAEFEARVRVISASLQYLELTAERPDATPHHRRLLQAYQQRLEMTRRIGDVGAQSLELRASHFGAALAALTAGRAELIQMHRSGVIHDSILRELESELDLEELRLRRLAGEHSPG
jgi:CPA1 family monovalent cation:H+ antiporter